MDQEKILNLDPIIHTPTRLAILSVLISSVKATFTFLKDSIGITDGNLSTHLSKLEASGYITIKKQFKDKKPQTVCSITKKGREAFENYVDQLEQIVQMQKKINK